MLSFLSDELEAYVNDHASPESDLFRELAEETRAKTERPQMMVGNVEGMFLRCITRAIGARRALEIGTFTGYSSLSIAHGLPEGGELITCDIDPVATSIAKKYWDRSAHGNKIRLALAPALETIETIDHELDLVFIDADKENYVNYWNACLLKLRAGGLVVADNVLWSGRVLDPKDDEDHAIVAFNEHVHSDGRVDHVMLSVRDGLMLATKR